jgi:hypothetical protein
VGAVSVGLCRVPGFHPRVRAYGVNRQTMHNPTLPQVRGNPPVIFAGESACPYGGTPRRETEQVAKTAR